MSGETTNTCRPAANAAPPSMRAPHACSSSPLTNNNVSRSRASSMHLTQCLDQASAVGSLPGELPGQSIRKGITSTPAAREHSRRIFPPTLLLLSGPASRCSPGVLSAGSLALVLTSPQLSQLRFAAVEFVSITTPDSLNRVRLGPESAVCVLPHRPSLPVPWNHWGRTILRKPKPALRQDRIGAGP